VREGWRRSRCPARRSASCGPRRRDLARSGRAGWTRRRCSSGRRTTLVRPPLSSLLKSRQLFLALSARLACSVLDWFRSKLKELGWGEAIALCESRTPIQKSCREMRQCCHCYDHSLLSVMTFPPSVSPLFYFWCCCNWKLGYCFSLSVSSSCVCRRRSELRGRYREGAGAWQWE
jgi:hypothetical protein